MSRRKRLMLVNDEGGRKGEWAGKLSTCILDLTPEKRKERKWNWAGWWSRCSSDKFLADLTGNSGAKFAQLKEKRQAWLGPPGIACLRSKAKANRKAALSAAERWATANVAGHLQWPPPSRSSPVLGKWRHWNSKGPLRHMTGTRSSVSWLQGYWITTLIYILHRNFEVIRLSETPKY